MAPEWEPGWAGWRTSVAAAVWRGEGSTGEDWYSDLLVAENQQQPATSYRLKEAMKLASTYKHNMSRLDRPRMLTTETKVLRVVALVWVMGEKGGLKRVEVKLFAGNLGRYEHEPRYGTP